MTLTSPVLTVAMDATIVALAVLMLTVAASRGMFEKGTTPRKGRTLIATGVGITALYYLVDLVLVVGPNSGSAQQLAGLDVWRQQARSLAALLSLAFIAAGFLVVAHQRRVVEQKMRSASAQVRQAEATVLESEGRFRALIEQFAEPLYCFEFQPPLDVDADLDQQVAATRDAVLVDCNKAYASLLKARHPGQALGTRLGTFGAAGDDAAFKAFFAAFIASGYRLAGYDLEYRNRAGAPRALRVHARGVWENGELTAVWASHQDVLALKQTEDALAAREAFQQVHARISTRLLTAPQEALNRAIQASLKDLCRHVTAEWAAVVWSDDAGAAGDLVATWIQPDASTGLKPSRIAPAVRELHRGQPLAFARLEDLSGNRRAALKELGVKAAALVPLIVDGVARGSCFVANRRMERDWSERNVEEIRVFAELFASSIARWKSRQDLDRVLDELERSKDRLEAENVYLQEEILSTHDFREIVGESADLKLCLRQVAQVAETPAPVLIQGETGTGKELIARALHELSDRSERPLVKVNCAALPDKLIESELFGHEPGAFTGARGRKRGRFDLADGGTLFLDEIGDFPRELQGKVLRVLQEGEFQRLGGTETIRVDVRIIAATNRNLLDAVARGDFRADLYYRINTFMIELPPLRERHGDVPLLAEHFVSVHAAQLGKPIRAISQAMLGQLESYSWPGNVRELENVIQRSLITSSEPTLVLDEPLVATRADGVIDEPRFDGPADLQSAERAHIETVLNEAGWRIAGNRGAAERLGVPPSTLRSRMKKLGIARDSA